MVAAPQNAILALGATTLLPLIQPLGGVFLAMLVVARGVRSAAVQAILAAGTLALFAALTGISVQRVLEIVAAGWLPVFVLAAIWRASGSVQLTLQLSVILTIIGLLVLLLVVGDMAALWQPLFDGLEQFYKDSGWDAVLNELQKARAEHASELAARMTVGLVVGTWFIAVLEFMLGGALFNQLPGESGRFGRFRDIDFGRVLAIGFVALLVLAFATGSSVLQHLGLVMFAAFLLQGFVVVHWLHLEGHAPSWTVFLTWATVLLVPQYAVIALAVTGFLDAWFQVRRRFEKTKGSKT